MDPWKKINAPCNTNSQCMSNTCGAPMGCDLLKKNNSTCPQFCNLPTTQPVTTPTFFPQTQLKK